MSWSTISPVQLAFLLWSATFFAAVISRLPLGMSTGNSLAISMLAAPVIELAVVLVVRRVRNAAKTLLLRPLPPAAYGEVALVACIALLAQPARFAAFALSAWLNEGDAGVIALGDSSTLGHTGGTNMAPWMHFGLTCILAPLVEELMFRGFLLPLWAQRRSVLAAIVLTSLVFAASHPNYVHAFMIGLLLGTLYMRTGVLRAAIFVHFVGNFTNLLPVLGQFAKPTENHGLASWSLHIGALIVFTAFTLCYLYFVPRTPAPQTAQRLQVSA